MGNWYAQLRNQLLLFLNERIEFRDLRGVLALLVLTEAKKVRFVLRPPAVKVQLVFVDNCLPELFDAPRLIFDHDTSGRLDVADFVVDTECISARPNSLDLDEP